MEHQVKFSQGGPHLEVDHFFWKVSTLMGAS